MNLQHLRREVSRLKSWAIPDDPVEVIRLIWRTTDGSVPEVSIVDYREQNKKEVQRRKSVIKRKINRRPW